MIKNKNMQMPTIIQVDSEKCVNCHACIGVCPVKYCNDASDVEKGIVVNPDLCIVCGACIKECTHGARYYIDDTEKFFNDLQSGEEIAILAAPAAYVNFPNQLYNLFGWLKSLGVTNFFDVSFGAEITTYQYYKAIKSGVKAPIIAQPCPSVVTYIETYRPKLIEHLAPTGSPVMNMARFIHEKYPNLKLAFLSPCIAKKIEFEDDNTNGFIDYNITIKNVKDYIKKHNVDLEAFEQVRFSGPKEALLGLLFSQPGGLYETLKKYRLPLKRHQVRKVEGCHIYEEYFEELERNIAENKCDVILVDVLNCQNGCNRGTGTIYDEYTTDEILKLQDERLEEQLADHYNDDKSEMELESILENMTNIDFSRQYTDRSDYFNSLLIADEEQIKILNEEMGKTTEADIKNCHACGYKSCENMATAILNGLYRPEQCHHFLEKFFMEKS